MTGLLIKLFVKNYTETKNPKVREDFGKLSGWVGIICNAILFCIKFFAGTIANSIAIIADVIPTIARLIGKLSYAILLACSNVSDKFSLSAKVFFKTLKGRDS